MKEPLLSIIIVSYRDSSLLLKRTIQSVQTFEDYELVLTDANERGSACSKGLAEDMESYPDIPVICGEWKNCDLAAAKNAGAARAGGTYLTFLTTHDVWNLQCAKKQLEVLQADPDVGLTFGCMWEPAVSSVSQVIFRRTVFEQLLGFDTRIHGDAEYDIWRRLSDKYKIAAVNNDQTVDFVGKRVLKRSRGLIDAVGYQQLYSRNRNMYRKNAEARAKLYRRMAYCYREKKYLFSWLNYTVRSRVLMRGEKGKGELPEAALQPPQRKAPAALSSREVTAEKEGSKMREKKSLKDPPFREVTAEKTSAKMQEEKSLKDPPFWDMPAEKENRKMQEKKSRQELTSKGVPEEKENSKTVAAFSTDGKREREEETRKGRIRIVKKEPVFSNVSVATNLRKDRAGVSLGGPWIYTPCITDRPVAGAKFEITTENDIFTEEGMRCFAKDTVVQRLTTGESGTAVSRELPCGKYRIREMGMNHGPFGSLKVRYAKIGCRNGKTDRENTDVEFWDEWPRTHIHVRKAVGEMPAWEKSRRNLFEDFLFGLFAAGDIFLADDARIPRGGLIRTFRCGENGEGHISMELPFGNYFVRELLSGSCYKHQDTKYPICFSGEDVKNGEAHLYVNGGNEIRSEMIRGKICGSVRDPEGSPIVGAETGLFLMETELFSGENAVRKAVTDENGLFFFRDIPCGDYIIRETGMPRGYEPEKNTQFVSLIFDGQCVRLNLTGRKMKAEEEEKDED